MPKRKKEPAGAGANTRLCDRCGCNRRHRIKMGSAMVETTCNGCGLYSMIPASEYVPAASPPTEPRRPKNEGRPRKDRRRKRKVAPEERAAYAKMKAQEAEMESRFRRAMRSA